MPEGRRFCERCGTAIGETTNFCPNCGAAQQPNPEVPTGPPPGIPETGRISTSTVPGIPSAPPASSGRSWGKIALGGCGALVLLFVLLIACSAIIAGGGGGNPGSGRTFTKDDYAELSTDPDAFRGASVDVVGRVLRNPEVRGDETSFQMFADPENSEWNTFVRAESAPSGLASGDSVRVQGAVRGSREGENAFGATIRAVEVDASSVEMVESEADRKAKLRP